MSVMYNPSLIAEARRAREVEARYARAHVDGFRWARRGVLPDQLDAELTTEIGLSVVPGHRPDPVYWTAFREGAETAALTDTLLRWEQIEDAPGTDVESAADAAIGEDVEP